VPSTGATDLSLCDGDEAPHAAAAAAHPAADTFFGAMVDEKLGEQVWITVVATGYGDKPAPRRDERAPGLREPAGEPRVSRIGGQSRDRRSERIDVDVPEFIPRF